MNKLLSCALALLLFSACAKKDPVDPPVTEPTDTLVVRAADFSFLPEIEQAGTVFFNRNGQPKDVLSIFKENGGNTVRLRLWHNPAGPHSALPEVVALAQRIRGLGLKLWLDLHYSDTWADPGQQSKPAAWQGLAQSTLRDSVFNYTKAVAALLQPEYIQIGNEINGGLLWDNGRINQPDQFAELLQSGAQAVRAASPQSKIMIHFAGLNNAEWFFNLLRDRQIDYDILALSFYPQWHGKDLNGLETTLQQFATNYGKDILLAEVAYPFTLAWDDNTNNVLGQADQLIAAYPATPEGQKNYLLEIRRILLDNPRGLGLAYWAPDWVAFKGSAATDGSSWENQALFGFDHQALPGFEVFKK